MFTKNMILQKKYKYWNIALIMAEKNAENK